MKNNYLRTPKRTTARTARALPQKTRGKSPVLLAKQVLAVFAFLLVMAGSAVAQTAYVNVPPASAGTSALNRGPSGAVAFQRVAAIYSDAELGNVNTSFPITTIGFNIATAANQAATGNIKIYLVNTTDASFLRSTTWSTLLASPTAMQLVYDGPLTIPATAGWYDITLTTPFNYTGDGIYMAFEWTRTSAASTAPTYTTNSTPVGGGNGWRGITDATAHQPTLSTSSAFRPWIRLGYTPPADDASVNAVYTLGKLPITNATVPHVIQASITNMGSADIVNRTFTLNVTGANTFTTTTVLPLLSFGQTAVISFPAFTPTNPGVNTITVTAPADAVAGNNTATAEQLVTSNTISYAVGNPPVVVGGAGITSGAGAGMGAFLTKYTVSGSQQVTVPVVRVGIGNNAPSVGKRVFAVVLDANGQLLARSAGYLIQTADLGNLVSFTIDNPPTVSNTSFYVGLAVTPNATTPYFPVGTQPETPVRSGAYYAVLGDTIFSGTPAPQEVTSLGRYIIEADLVPVALPAADLGVISIDGLASGCGLSATQQVCVSIVNFGSAAQTGFPVSYTLNGGTAITETVGSTLAPGDTLNYCFATTADLSTVGNYNFISYTGLTGDATPANDTTNLSIVSSATISAAFTGLPSSVCSSASAITLNGTPAGGTFSGTGVTGNTFDPAVAGVGSHTLTYTVTQGPCSGTATATIMVEAMPAAPTVTNGERCGTGSVELTADSPAGSTVVWYANATGGTPIGLGDTLNTPSISATTTYYAASASSLMAAGNVGPVNGAAVGAGAIGGPFTNEMLFNAIQAFRLDSVTLISDGAGTYTFGIRNTLSTNAGSFVMDSVTITLPGAGTHRVYLGFEIPAGTGMTLGLLNATTGSGGLFRNTAGAVYPYTLPGVVAITGAAFGADPFTSPRYYNFYNWSVSVSSGCESARVPVTATVNPAPLAPTAVGAERCGPGSVTLTATAPAGVPVWFTAATGGTPVGVGPNFTTPSLTTTTTYYVAAANVNAAGNVGPVNGTAVGAGASGGPFTNEMLFDALQPIRIDSVTLISDAAGTYTIGVRNTLSTNTGSYVMDSVIVTVPGAGTHRVFLGLSVPAGTGYTLGLLNATTGSGGLFRNTAGAVYPYTLAGVAAITGAAFGADPFTSPRYYNFYNWSVSTLNDCESARVAVAATINAAPNAAFTFTNTGNTFNFQATSTTGTYSWTFSGGTPATSTVANPSVSFAGPGSYTVTLTVVANGCTATTTQTVVISSANEALNQLLSVYPNPSTGLVTLDLAHAAGMEVVEVYNTLGQLVHRQQLGGQQQAMLNLSKLAEGAYTVRVSGNELQFVKQLLLQK